MGYGIAQWLGILLSVLRQALDPCRLLPCMYKWSPTPHVQAILTCMYAQVVPYGQAPGWYLKKRNLSFSTICHLKEGFSSLFRLNKRTNILSPGSVAQLVRDVYLKSAWVWISCRLKKKKGPHKSNTSRTFTSLSLRKLEPPTASPQEALTTSPPVVTQPISKAWQIYHGLLRQPFQ